MSNNVEFKLNSAGVVQLLKSATGLVAEYGNAAMQSLGDGFEMETGIKGDRASCYIRAATKEAKKKVSKDNILLKAVGV